jgi:hypothetical protein
VHHNPKEEKVGMRGGDLEKYTDKKENKIFLIYKEI